MTDIKRHIRAGIVNEGERGIKSDVVSDFMLRVLGKAQNSLLAAFLHIRVQDLKQDVLCAALDETGCEAWTTLWPYHINVLRCATGFRARKKICTLCKQAVQMAPSVCTTSFASQNIADNWL